MPPSGSVEEQVAAKRRPVNNVLGGTPGHKVVMDEGIDRAWQSRAG
jgi:hypothetical protein